LFFICRIATIASALNSSSTTLHFCAKFSSVDIDEFLICSWHFVAVSKCRIHFKGSEVLPLLGFMEET